VSENERTPDETERTLRETVDYWREEALIAEEQGDDEQAQKCFQKADALSRRLRPSVARSGRQPKGKGYHGRTPGSLNGLCSRCALFLVRTARGSRARYRRAQSRRSGLHGRES
jgi:hypothetical protein